MIKTAYIDLDDVTDYHDFTTIDTPEAERRRMNVGDLWINAIICNACGSEVRSRNRHDMVYCACGECSVDGGSWYHKAGYKTTLPQNACVPYKDAA